MVEAACWSASIVAPILEDLALALLELA